MRPSRSVARPDSEAVHGVAHELLDRLIGVEGERHTAALADQLIGLGVESLIGHLRRRRAQLPERIGEAAGLAPEVLDLLCLEVHPDAQAGLGGLGRHRVGHGGGDPRGIAEPQVERERTRQRQRHGRHPLPGAATRRLFAAPRGMVPLGRVLEDLGDQIRGLGARSLGPGARVPRPGA
jgi:hypothetical protein